MVHFTEAAEDLCLEEAVPEVVEEVDGALVAGHGFGVVAEVVVGVAETVPRAGLTASIAEFFEQSEGSCTAGEGLRVVAEPGPVPAERVERSRLPEPVAEGEVEVERLLGVAQCLFVVAQPGGDVGDVAVDVRQAGSVAGLGVQRDAPLEL